jgi:deoxyribonuclease-4
MRILLGPAGIPSDTKSGGTVEGIARVAELGLQAMEVEFVRGVHMKNEMAKEAGDVARRAGIKLSVHAPYFINLCNPDVKGASQKRILDSCERAHLMGAWVVVFHPGYYGKLEPEQALQRVLDTCREMSDILKREKWNVSLGLETTGKMSQFGTVDEILAICKKLKRCVPVIDWAHLYAKYQGKPDFAGILDKVIKAGFDTLHTHFSNIEFTEKGERRHLTLEHRKPDFEYVAKVILKSKLKEITLISESPVLERDSFVMKKVLEKNGYTFD